MKEKHTGSKRIKEKENKRRRMRIKEKERKKIVSFLLTKNNTGVVLQQDFAEKIKFFC